jgi:hypothetical protein
VGHGKGELMPQKSKTHYEEVPLAVAQKIVEEQIAIQPSQATRSEQFRGPTKKRSHKPPKVKAEVAVEREDS